MNTSSKSTCQILKTLRWFLVALLFGATLLIPTQARADSIKSGVFVLGTHLGNANAVSWSLMTAYDPSKQAHPGGTQFVRDRLLWSIPLARTLGLPTAELERLEKDLNNLEFRDMFNRMQPILQTYRNAVANRFGNNAPAVFELAIQHTYASAMIRNAKTDRPETADRWRRFAADYGTQMVNNITTSRLEATLSFATDFINRTNSGESFASLEQFTEVMWNRWQQDFLGAPAWGTGPGPGPGPGPGVIVFNTSGQLTKFDPMDPQRKNHHAKLHLVQLKAGVKYDIDLESGNGTYGSPGFFDVWLRLEDPSGRTLFSNDDGGEGLNARISFTPQFSGTYRLIVTSYSSGATGSYTLRVTQK